jgi:hypothetical protein
MKLLFDTTSGGFAAQRICHDREILRGLLLLRFPPYHRGDEGRTILMADFFVGAIALPPIIAPNVKKETKSNQR